MQKLDEVERIIGYEFNDKSILGRAFTHSSYANDILGNSNLSNERLEFVGDAILDFVIGSELFKRYPDEQEGFLSKLRSEIVCENSLYQAAKKLGINKYLKLGNGEKHTDGINRPSIVADLVESLVAAVYIDSNIENAILVAHRILDETIELGCRGLLKDDFKSNLQEYLQSLTKEMPSYENMTKSGPDHNPTFYVEVFSEGNLLGKGFGKTKKEAENMAAKDALFKLDKDKTKLKK